MTGIAHLDASGDVLDGFVYAYNSAGQVGSETDFGDAENLVGPISGISSPDVVDEAMLASLESGGSSSGSTSGSSSGSMDGLTATTSYSYDASGQLTGSGLQSYSYDANNNRVGSGYVIGPDNQVLSDGTWNYSYDANGNEIGKTNIATGVSWSYGYDDANRLSAPRLAVRLRPGKSRLNSRIGRKSHQNIDNPCVSEHDRGYE